MFSDVETMFSDLEGGFPPWDTTEPPFLFPDLIEDPSLSKPEPVSSGSGSDKSNPDLTDPVSGLFETNRNSTKCRSSVVSIVDERKRRRKLSNRESARRSRMRKQRHLENLGAQGNRLKRVNLELMNRLNLLVNQNDAVRVENELLRSESVRLRQRLWDVRRVLQVRQLQRHLNPFAWRNSVTCINEGQLLHHSLIT